MQQKYGDNKRPNYSPSTSFNYGRAQNNGQSQRRDRDNGNEQHPRRRVDRYRREVFTINEKIVKQNDQIISLLREIRDRLPGPAGNPVSDNFSESLATSSAIDDDRGEDETADR